MILQINSLIKKNTFNNNEIVIYGTTSNSSYLAFLLKKEEIRVDAFYSNEKKDKMRGIKVHKIEELQNMDWKENIRILVLSSLYEKALNDLKNTKFFKEKKIIKIRDTSKRKKSKSQKIRYFFSLLHGYRMYKKLKKKYPESNILVCPGRSGDTYVAGAFLSEYLIKEQIENYVLTVIGGASESVAKLFDIKQIEKITLHDTTSLINLRRLIGADRFDLKILHFTMGHSPVSVMNGLISNPRITLADVYKYAVYMLEEDSLPEKPIKKENKETVKTLFSNLDLIPKKTVILSPYANSYSDDNLSVMWETMAEMLISAGYTVCTNSVGKSEPPIKNTTPIFFSIEDSISIMEYAGYYIGLRSGLSDIISSANTKKIIFYRNNWNLGSFKNFHSLNEMRFCNDAIEIEYDPSSPIFKDSFTTLLFIQKFFLENSLLDDE